MPAVKNQQSPPAPKAVLPAPAQPQPAAWAVPVPRGRPSWSGLLRLSLVSVPVQAYPAVSSPSASPFHLLHANCGRRLQYQKHYPEHGPVESEAIVRGYEDAPDHWLIVEPEELDRLRPARDKALILEQFVPIQDVAPTLFAGRSLYLVPDGPAAHHPYSVLVDAFQQAGRGALARVVLSSQRQLVLVRPSSRLLIVDVLHYPARVRSAASWEAGLPPSAATEAERVLAGQLIAMASGPADW